MFPIDLQTCLILIRNNFKQRNLFVRTVFSPFGFYDYFTLCNAILRCIGLYTYFILHIHLNFHVQDILRNDKYKRGPLCVSL
jgi:hypothetical protein